MVAEMTFPQLERTINPTHDIKLFAGRSNTKLAQEIADYLGTSIGPMVVKNFADGEIYVQVKESVRGDDVFIIQPLCNPVNENLMELSQECSFRYNCLIHRLNLKEFSFFYHS